MEQLSGLTVLEIAGLVKATRRKVGRQRGGSGRDGAGSCAAGGGGAAAAPAEEKTTFDVILKEMGANKIGVIKEVRGRCRVSAWRKQGAGGRRAQDIKEGVTKAEAEEIKKKIEAAGAKVEIK